MLNFSSFGLALVRFSSSLYLNVIESFSNIKKVTSFFILALLLVSCGAGSGGDETPIEPEETVGEETVEILRVGNGSGDSFIEGALSASQTSLDAGESTTIQVNVVNQAGDPPTGTTTLNFSSVCVSSALASFDEPIYPTAGLATITYNAQGCSGDDIVTVTLFETGETANVTLSVQAPEVLALSFTASSSSQLSLAGIGGDETTELTFALTGPQGVPIIGDTVSFSINTSVGGASILAGRETAISDDNGSVRTILKSGTVAGPVSVLAVHDATGIQGLSGDIIISTGIPVASRFSLSYGPFNPANAFDTDGIAVDLTVIASDQFGNSPPDGTRISFVAPESGQIESSCELSSGSCGVTWISTSPRPADGRLELIAYTDGAEDYVDNNGNFVFDGADGAISDLGEPFADENENGVYDVGEFFFDTNASSSRNSGNGLWDGPCLIEADASAICTGESTTTISDTVTVVLSTNTPTLYTTTGTFAPANITGTFSSGIVAAIAMQQGTTFSVSDLFLGDNNVSASNPMPSGTTIVFSIEGSGISLQGKTSFIVEDSRSPTGSYFANLSAAAVALAPDLPTGIRLLLTVTTPDNTVGEFSWPVTVTL